MSEIPEDIMKAAESAATAWYGGLEGNTASFRSMKMRFAAAILAERERCARVARQTFNQEDHGSNAARCGLLIHDAILRGDA